MRKIPFKIFNSTYGCLISLIFLLSIAAFAVTIDIPFSKSNSPFKWKSPIISVSKDSIYFNEKPLCASSVVEKIPNKEHNPIIPQLASAIKSFQVKASIDSIFIQLDKSLSFKYAFTIMNTCKSLQVLHILFMVKNTKGIQTYICGWNSPHQPTDSNDHCSAATKITLIFSDSIITIGYKFGFIKTLFINGKDSAHILDSLSADLTREKKQYRSSISPDSVIIAFDYDYPYSSVIKYMDFARSFGFTDVSLAKLSIDSDSTTAKKLCTLFNRSRESIQDTVYVRVKELYALYRKQFKKEPRPSGEIIVNLGIDQSGKVTYARVHESAIPDKPFQKKILSIIRKWDFGATESPNNETDVLYPFDFSDTTK